MIILPFQDYHNTGEEIFAKIVSNVPGDNPNVPVTVKITTFFGDIDLLESNLLLEHYLHRVRIFNTVVTNAYNHGRLTMSLLDPWEFQFITTDNAKTSRGGGKVSLL
jgi:hypothetical protein